MIPHRLWGRDSELRKGVANPSPKPKSCNTPLPLQQAEVTQEDWNRAEGFSGSFSFYSKVLFGFPLDIPAAPGAPEHSGVWRGGGFAKSDDTGKPAPGWTNTSFSPGPCPGEAFPRQRTRARPFPSGTVPVVTHGGPQGTWSPGLSLLWPCVTAVLQGHNPSSLGHTRDCCACAPRLRTLGVEPEVPPEPRFAPSPSSAPGLHSVPPSGVCRNEQTDKPVNSPPAPAVTLASAAPPHRP